jgi:hypothetical protein
MFIELKSAVVSLGAGTAGIVASAQIPGEFAWIRSVAELGSFGLVAFAAILLLVKVAPAFISHLDKARDRFLEELKEERLQRQRHAEQLDGSLDKINESLRGIHHTIQGKP